MPSIDLHTIIQFVAKGSDVPGGDTPEYIAAQTFDMLGVPFIICLLAALIAGFCIFAFRNKISKNLKKILTVAICAFAFCGILTSATQVFAQNANSEALPDKVIAYVDKQTGEITFDDNNYYLTNTQEKALQLNSVCVDATTEGQTVPDIYDTSFKIAGFGSSIYEGNPSPIPQPPISETVLYVGDQEKLTLGMAAEKETAIALIDKAALEITISLQTVDISVEVTYDAGEGRFPGGNPTLVKTSSWGGAYNLPSGEAETPTAANKKLIG